MAIQLKNNAVSNLASSILAADVSLTVTASTGSLFPTLAVGDWFYAALEDTSHNIEIIKVTARAGDNMTIVRAQEGTTALAFAAGSLVELRVTAQTFTDAIAASASYITKTASTGSAALPSSTTANRDASPALGYLRYNTDLSQFEGYGASGWGTVGGAGATGGGTDKVFVETDQTVNTNYTLTSGKNAMSAGPVTIGASVTVTVPAGATWTIV